MDSRPDIALVPVEHDLDVTTVDALRSALDALIDGGCRRIILNMSEVSYVDSAGMALLLGAVRRMRSFGGLLSMINASGQVMAALRRSRLVDFAPVSASLPGRHRVRPLDPAAQPLWRTSLPIDRRNFADTRASVAQLLQRASLSDDELFDANLAVGEAMGNAIDHADGQDASVTVTGYQDRVVMEVSDAGPGFDPEETPEPEPESCSERGRGIKLMNLLADSVTIAPRVAGSGTTVRLVKMTDPGA